MENHIFPLALQWRSREITFFLITRCRRNLRTVFSELQRRLVSYYINSRPSHKSPDTCRLSTWQWSFFFFLSSEILILDPVVLTYVHMCETQFFHLYVDLILCRVLCKQIMERNYLSPLLSLKIPVQNKEGRNRNRCLDHPWGRPVRIYLFKC